jgi:N-acetylglucosaminyldiphosphoundecaprenol N-acetyl-beta-D-mannosaminyltransferase
MNSLETSPKANVLGIAIEAVDMEGALVRIAEELRNRRKGYVCLAGVHGIMEAHRDPRLSAIYAASALTLPDGQPTAWVGRWQGHRSMRRVTGPDVMLEIFQRKEFMQYTHFFYGGDENVAGELRDRLIRRFPWARILGTYTPPFRDLNLEEEQSLIEHVRELKPNVIWVGISTPKQERFMNRYLHQLDTTLMFGVGAAFDYHTGRIQDAPEWVKRMGMQWLHRLKQDPRRLWKRYARNNLTFLWHIGLQLTGLRKCSGIPFVDVLLPVSQNITGCEAILKSTLLRIITTGLFSTRSKAMKGTSSEGQSSHWVLMCGTNLVFFRSVIRRFRLRRNSSYE